MDLQNYWLQERTSVAQMKEIIGLEQLLKALHADMRRDTKPKTYQEAGELADEYVQTRKTVEDCDCKVSVGSQGRCYSCDKIQDAC